MNDKDAFNKWCNKHTDFSRGALSSLFGVDVRTMRRYASGETSIPIAILRMMDIFDQHTNVENEYLSKFCK
jgi:hypothetical protein